MQRSLNGYKEDVLNGNFEMKPFEGYELVYRGGKLLTLIKTDPYYKRSCALVLMDKKED